MYDAILFDKTISVINNGEVITILYPQDWMALNAYKSIKECCNRFSMEPANTVIPKIYVFGEIHTWEQYLKRLLLTAKKIGAIIHENSPEVRLCE